MNIFKSRLIFGAIKGIISTVFKTVYRILGLFNLQITLLVLVVGLILLITGVFASVPAILTAFWIALALSIVLAGFLTVSKVKKWGGKIFKKKKDTRLEHADVSQVPEKLNGEQPNNVNQNVAPTKPSYNEYQTQTANITQAPVEIRYEPKVIYPIYFRAKQNPNYVFAEYADRYELFYDNGYNLSKVRTDYKK